MAQLFELKAQKRKTFLVCSQNFAYIEIIKTCIKKVEPGNGINMKLYLRRTLVLQELC